MSEPFGAALGFTPTAVTVNSQAWRLPFQLSTVDYEYSPSDELAGSGFGYGPFGEEPFGGFGE